MRLLFWFLLLGPVLFLAFYLPSFVTVALVNAHFNYATHRPREDGTVEILNLNHNFLYHFLNFCGHGFYFHKNHHLKPWLFNPSPQNFVKDEAKRHNVTGGTLR